MVDIVIINWNSDDYLNQCINSIFIEDNIQLIGTVFVIDNNSKDNSLTKITTYDKLKIIENSENLGFATACNQGFRECCSQYVLLLNPDAQLKKSTLSDCLEFLESNSKIDILGCQLLNDEAQVTYSCSRFPSPSGFLNESLGLSKLAPTIFIPGLLMTDFDHKESRFVDQVMGAFMFMRTAIFKKVGYFDEQFFVYFEEVDFSKRLSDVGGKCYFNSDIKAIHIGKGTTESIKVFRLFLILQSRLKYAKKHFSKIGYLITWVSTFLIEPLSRILLLLFRGKFKEIVSVLKGYNLLLFNKNSYTKNSL